ncbi:hypothetical protein AB0B04_18765 [Streptomyces xinghaiensis]|uniref:Uncharacterized protein n=2 Tax=Streptomyces TaxID=1883 RepID=A0A3R7IZS4_9ACTN|nr:MULTISPECIES: hypothetical protein [Streptomyces]KNE81402.1 hypothetical protein ADZ36_16630 [Streptomyces fradiae]OFA48256.1 hypothetical protein BEN35_19135 [Streptomyces fradiae]PQM20675.1 hypothetical protein Sfr7A_26180 [Streptomyces xinghaiensis]RKM92615.1 hypothetical protein SFRA_024830 [Streptomyces xinghaiensis]RNC70583.1 hypothetical protein DC095_025820 [Streptomyces xinghaiensis]
MTTPYESTDDPRPGRAWTVRLTGHSDRSATVTCTTTACRMPPRSRDIAALRTFAARHAAAHARAATLRPTASCHCRSQQCSAHPGTTARCTDTAVMILRHDPIMRRVWSVEEVCPACAALTPNATVLARAARPHRSSEQPAPQVPAPARPDVPGGFTSATTTARSVQDRPAPVRRSRRSGHKH